MSRRAASSKPRLTKVTIPERAGPHVQLIFAEVRRQRFVLDELADGSGVLKSTIKLWRGRQAPSLESLEAALGFLGFDLTPIPRDRVLDPELVKRLTPIAEEMRETMPETVQALVEIVASQARRIEEEQARRCVRRTGLPRAKPLKATKSDP